MCTMHWEIILYLTWVSCINCLLRYSNFLLEIFSTVLYISYWLCQLSLIFLMTPFLGNFNFRQKFIEHDFLMEKLSREASIYIVMEGSEPPFFTRFFCWDSGKSSVRRYIIMKLSPQFDMFSAIWFSFLLLGTDAWELIPKETYYSEKRGHSNFKCKPSLVVLTA